MRIIAGDFRRRKLLSPPHNAPTRPIPDRVKESVFSILRGHIPNALVFDAFAGSGSVGLEAVSRGAAKVVFVENHREMAKTLQRNIELLKCGDRAEVFIGDALGAGALARCPRPVTIAFFDPPYAMVEDQLGWKRIKAQLEQIVPLLSDDGYLLVRTPWPCRHEIWPEGVTPPTKIHPREKSHRQQVGDDDRAGSPTPLEGGQHRPKGKARWRWKDNEAGGSWLEVGKGKHAAPRDDDEDLVEIDDLEEGQSFEEAFNAIDAEREADPDAAEATGPLAADGSVIKPEILPVDLHIENALGPETHEYGTTAVHFYMKKR